VYSPVKVYNTGPTGGTRTKRAMEFADCRERDDRTEWWNGAINRNGRVDAQRLQVHTTPEDVESFLHLVAAMGVYAKCGACGQYFSLRNAIGRWQCRSPVTGILQDHHNPANDDINTRPPHHSIKGWHYLALVDAGLLEAPELHEGRYTAEYNPNSGQLVRLCIKRHACEDEDNSAERKWGR
jgi:hypothetical protein